MIWRAFLTLYIPLIAAVLSVGWGLDRLWALRDRAAEPTALTRERPLAQLILSGLAHGQSAAQLAELSERELQLVPLDDLVATPFARRLAAGEPQMLVRVDGASESYWPMPGEQVLRLLAPPAAVEASVLYRTLMGLFYAVLGLCVLAWLWPLSRDLNRLARHTRLVGGAAPPQPLALRPTSPLAELAAAFNAMSERLRSLLQSYKEMTYAVSHELRTPLARLKFHLAGLSPEAPAAGVHLEGMAADIQQMDGLITQLLNYASFEQDAGELDWSEGDIRDLALGLVEQLRLSQPALTFAVSPHTLLLRCDPYLLERALSNVLHNAARHAKTQVAVAWQASAAGVEIWVDDDGLGVAPDYRQRIFESFVRGPGAEAGAGFGLGLAIVRRILQWHGGSASVTDSPLGGARFCLRLPPAPGSTA